MEKFKPSKQRGLISVWEKNSPQGGLDGRRVRPLLDFLARQALRQLLQVLETPAGFMVKSKIMPTSLVSHIPYFTSKFGTSSLSRNEFILKLVSLYEINHKSDEQTSKRTFKLIEITVREASCSIIIKPIDTFTDAKRKQMNRSFR